MSWGRRTTKLEFGVPGTSNYIKYNIQNYTEQNYTKLW